MEKNIYNNLDKRKKIILTFFIIMITLFSTLCMTLCPIWNGQIPCHRNQYELLADAILEGHLNIDYGEVDSKLLNMDNPYDPAKREELGVKFHWDHSFYKGKYYMYFGVAPVFLTFIPYKLITGHSLTTYHATQLYAILFIIGMFLLLFNICKFFFNKTKFSIYLFLSSALSILSIWLSIEQPALYCTAIVSGLCMAIWALYFFVKAVYGDYSLNKSIVYAIIGGLFGALTFACRPPIGLVNILMIPMLVTFLKKHGLNKKVILKVLLVFIPYILIAVLLMIYNYARFENIFEFGQSYQLTVADQHNYTNLFSRINIGEILQKLFLNFFETDKYYKAFPYISISGAFINFPILIIPYILIFNKKYRKSLSDKKLFPLYIMLMILPFIITIIDILNTPFLNERYRLDIYYVLSILTFISIANYYSIKTNDNIKKDWLKWIIIIISIYTIIKCILLFFIPYDYNYIAYFHLNNYYTLLKPYTG